ncbi:hypothetical protein ACFVWF_33125 [Rhodococcus qingshengii]|uniref:hypothetical protein n=1 Tax=Rhodococcus qingshengii TaxID=334542 RepID=UPI0036DC38BF
MTSQPQPSHKQKKQSSGVLVRAQILDDWQTLAPWRGAPSWWIAAARASETAKDRYSTVDDDE